MQPLSLDNDEPARRGKSEIVAMPAAVDDRADHARPDLNARALPSRETRPL